MFCRRGISCLLNCITKTVQVTDSRKYLLEVRILVNPDAHYSAISSLVSQVTVMTALLGITMRCSGIIH
jgi:hypothetical protein